MNTLFVIYFDEGARDYLTVWDAVSAFRRDYPQDYVEAARAELRDVVSRAPSDEALRDEANRLHCDFNPDAIGMSHVEFFAALDEALG